MMAVLIRRIRDGTVKLAPGKNDGWYQYQVYALETMLLPEKGQEDGKLLLTAEYKKRLIEAFKALVAKRRETHATATRSKTVPRRQPLGEQRGLPPAADRALRHLLSPHRPGLRIPARLPQGGCRPGAAEENARPAAGRPAGAVA